MLWILRYRSSGHSVGRMLASNMILKEIAPLAGTSNLKSEKGETLDPVRDFDTPVALDLPVILNHADRHRVSELGGELSAFRDSYIPKLMCLAA